MALTAPPRTETKETKETKELPFTTLLLRCGFVGEWLAEALPQFSRDVVGVVASYAVYGSAGKDKKPDHLFSFGSEGKEDGQFQGACYAVASAPSGEIWVSDARAVQIFSCDGAYLRRAAPDELKNGARCIAFDAHADTHADTHAERDADTHADSTDSKHARTSTHTSKHTSKQQQTQTSKNKIANTQCEVFIADYAGRRIVVCDVKGQFIRAFCSEQLGQPWGVACTSLSARDADTHAHAHTSTDAIAHTSTSTHTVETKEAKHTDKDTLKEKEKDKGLVFVVDAQQSNVCVFHRDGTFLRVFGVFADGSTHTHILGTLNAPRVVEVHNGEVWVSCRRFGVQVFSLSGTPLRRISKTGVCGFAFDRDDNLLLADSDRARIDAYNHTHTTNHTTTHEAESEADVNSKLTSFGDADADKPSKDFHGRTFSHIFFGSRLFSVHVDVMGRMFMCGFNKTVYVCAFDVLTDSVDSVDSVDSLDKSDRACDTGTRRLPLVTLRDLADR